MSILLDNWIFYIEYRESMTYIFIRILGETLISKLFWDRAYKLIEIVLILLSEPDLGTCPMYKNIVLHRNALHETVVMYTDRNLIAF
jgi:hypothetical protein